MFCYNFLGIAHHAVNRYFCFRYFVLHLHHVTYGQFELHGISAAHPSLLLLFAISWTYGINLFNFPHGPGPSGFKGMALEFDSQSLYPLNLASEISSHNVNNTVRMSTLYTDSVYEVDILTASSSCSHNRVS